MNRSELNARSQLVIIPASTPKAAAVRMLAEYCGARDIDPWSQQVVGLLSLAQDRLGKPTNTSFRLSDLSPSPDLREQTLFRCPARKRAAPDHRNGIPKAFTRHHEQSPKSKFRLLTLNNGFVCHVGDAPIAVASDRRSIVREYSSKYAGLVHFYDHDLEGQRDSALQIEGRALLIAGDNRGANYCHWVADTLPRLACLGEPGRRRDVYILTGPLTAQFQRDTLRMCGIDEDRIVQLNNFGAIRAPEILVPSDIHRTSHPANRGAAWALKFLRDNLASGAYSGLDQLARHTKIYVSRGDATRRRVINEDEFVAQLRKLGYVPLTLSGMTVAEQVSAFSHATHVIGAHGAGLANILFAESSARLIELFPSDYGTAAFYVLAESSGVGYASYIAERTIQGDRPQTDDMIVDVPRFIDRCSDLL